LTIGEHEGQVEVSKHEAAHSSHADSARKMHEDKGVDFDMILQAQKAATRLQVRQHEQHDPGSSDDESTAPDLEVHAHEQHDSDSSDEGSHICCGLEVDAHSLKSKGRALPKIAGLVEFSDSEEEKGSESEDENESKSGDKEEHDKAHFESAEDQ